MAAEKEPFDSRPSEIWAKAAKPSQRAKPTGNVSLCVAGEALIDFLPRETKEGEACYLPKAGGSPFNVCVSARRMGLPVHYFSGISTDLFGEDLYKHLRREKVDLALVQRTPRPTTLAYVSKSSGADVKYAFFKENAADRCVTPEDALRAVEGRQFGAVHMSLGAVTLEDEGMRAVFETLFYRAQELGAFTSFDPNIRPLMIKNGTEAYCKLIEDLLRTVDLAKASDADIEFLYGKDAPLKGVAKKWLNIGARLVVITRGPDGVSAYYRLREDDDVVSIHIRPPHGSGADPAKASVIDAEGKAAPIADTVGAGDTCMGGLLYGLLGGGGRMSLASLLAGNSAWDEESGQRLRELMQLAVTGAAINCSRSGCDPPTCDEVGQALAAVRF